MKGLTFECIGGIIAQQCFEKYTWTITEASILADDEQVESPGETSMTIKSATATGLEVSASVRERSVFVSMTGCQCEI
jgi:hypothetical protein